MRRPAWYFALGFCLAAVAAWGRKELLYAQLPPLPVCDCQSVLNQFPLSAYCVGTGTEQMACEGDLGTATCIMSGSMEWTPTVPTCAQSPWGGAYEPPYLWCSNNMLTFDPGSPWGAEDIADTQSCPSPTDCLSSWPRITMQVAYLTQYGPPPCNNCGVPPKIMTAYRIFNCVLP
ncbi:MAG: hypothetical protein ACE5F1_12490 [Planctomycetota bacterium]